MKMLNTPFKAISSMKSWVAQLARRTLSTKNGILGSLVIVTGLLITIVIVFKPIPEKKEVQETVWPVTAIPAAPRQHSPELSLYGRVESPRQSSLTAAVTAYVSTVPVLEGTWVNAGDLLIQLDSIDATLVVERREADLAESKANIETLKLNVADNLKILEHEKSLYALAQKRSKRHEQLRQQKSISEETLNLVLSDTNRQAILLSRHQGLVNDANNQLARAASSIKRSEAVLREAEMNLARTQITAPFTGRVTSVMVSPGELVRPGVALVEMYDAAKMEVRTQIPTNSLSSIKRALTAGEQLSAFVLLGEDKIATILTRLSGEVSRGKSSVDGLFTLPDETNLELGRAVNLVLSLPKIAGTMLVPVQSMYGHDRVFVIMNDRLQGVNVDRVGELRDEKGFLNVLIRSPEISDGIPIVTSQLSNAITGLKVSHNNSLPNVAVTMPVDAKKNSS
ncbi:MAG: HlyD family efflux transporter periplasmic adaptor subunit [bacterium]|nr:HlyD family efflux transporter periplasmic adaptor subunit [Gammaproteobacteria bacterium]HIL94313.1 HlyD family efflux transporter periplasmic adaptor subunit [Pseudomonadales bacterium]